MKKWWPIFIIIFILCIDFWNWNKSEPLILFMPYWMWYVFTLTLIIAVSFAIFAKYEWREND